MACTKRITTTNIVTSFLWKLMERASTQIINLVVQIILSRMIAPEEFGSLAIMIVFYNIASIFVQKGLSSSLIRKKQVDNYDYDTALFASLVVAIILYIILFCFSPLIASIYKLKILKNSLRVLSLNLIFGAVYCIQNAILIRQMKFKIIFIRGLIASVISGCIGIGMALYGYGLWALVAQIVSNQVLLCITIINRIEWKPKLRFSYEKLKEILSFGGRILISELLVYIVESFRTLVIGKRFSAESLSYYDRGQVYPATLMRSIYDTLGGVLLPVYSENQDEPNILSVAMYNTMSITMYIVTPFFVGLAATAKPLISILLTEKWLPCAPFFMLFCFYQVTYPIQGITRQIIYARGRSDLVLKMEIIKGIIIMITLSISMQYGVFAIAISALVTNYVITIINLIYTKKVIPISIRTVFFKIKNTIIYNIIMFFIVYILNFINVNNIVKLLSQIFIGIIIYLGLSLIFSDENFIKCKTLLKTLMISKNRKISNSV